MADKQIMVKHTDELIKLSHKEDEEFITYTKSLIDKYEKAGISVKPLFQAIKVNYKVVNTIYTDF